MTIDQVRELYQLWWATDEDRRLAKRDELLHGTVLVRRDDEGLARRVDPGTITPGWRWGWR